MIQSNNIDQGIDKLTKSVVGTQNDIAATNIENNAMQNNISMDVPESAFTGEEIKTTGIFTKGKKVLKGIVEEALDQEKRMVPAEVRAKEPSYTKPVKEENVPQDKPDELKITPEEDKMLQETIDERQKMIDENVPYTAPSPTPKQRLEGVQKFELNTTFYSDDELRATLLTTSAKLANDPKVQKTTLADLKKAMIDDGIAESEAERRLKGLDMNAKVGDYDLTKKIMAARDEYNTRALKINEFMQKASVEGLTDVEKYNLLVDMKTNAILYQEITGAAREVGTALNAFKDIRNLGPNVQLKDIKQVLDENMSDDALERLTKLYNQSTSQSAKNKLINLQEGGFNKLMDSAYYTFMSNLLNSPKTWMDNLIGSTLHGSLITVEDFLAVPFGKIRRATLKGLNKETELPQEILELEDVLTGLKGFWGGLQDGIEGAAHVIKTGDRAGYKGEFKMRNPITAENLIPDFNIKVNNPFTEHTYNFNQSTLKDSWVGKMIDGIGFIQSVPMRALAAGDEIVGNTMVRMSLHKEASKYVRNETKRLRAEGFSDQEIRERLVKDVADFMETQPGEIYASTKEVKDMIQFTYKWDKTYRLDRAYSSINKALNHPLIRWATPFSNTLTKIVDQTASRIPGMNVISPQFWKDMDRGGKYADRAMARLTTGTIGMGGAYFAASEGKLTGSGPTDFAQSDALRKTGWQPYSIIFEMSELTDDQVARLKKLTSVSVGNGKYYVSYQRFDMLAQILAMGADLNDAHRFSKEDPTSSANQELFMAYATSSAEFMSNLPVMQFVGEMTSMFRGNYEDRGEMMLDLLERMTIQMGQAAALSIPGVGLTQSTLANQIAQQLDKEKRVRGGDTLAFGFDDKASNAIDKLRNKVYSRIPVLRGELDLELDNAGRPIYNQNTVHEHWINKDYEAAMINLIPSAMVSKERRSPMDEVLSEYFYGISKPAEKLEGVTMSGLQYNNYKKLYGQKVKLPIIDMHGNEIMQNMEQAIVTRVRAIEKEYADNGQYLPYGDVRDEIDSVVSAYRAEGRRRLVGDSEETEPGVSIYTGKWMDEDGIEHMALHPELSEGVNKYKRFKRFSKNP